jgi:hypothetical protein
MHTEKTIEALILELSNTASDLLVGLQCQDTAEVLRKALLLEKLANEYGVSSLAQTAQAIAHAAESGNLEVAILLETEIHVRLNQAATLTHRIFEE